MTHQLHTMSLAMRLIVRLCFAARTNRVYILLIDSILIISTRFACHEEYQLWKVNNRFNDEPEAIIELSHFKIVES